MANKMFVGEVINHRYRNRDNNDIKFKVIEVSPDIICEFDCNFGYRVGYDTKDQSLMVWLDPAGGPMMYVNEYTLCGYILRKIWFEKGKTLMMFN